MRGSDVSLKDHWDIYDGHDLVVHLAGQCGVPTSIENPRRDFEVNTIGTFNALEYARKHNSTFIFASTNKVYPIHDSFAFDPKDDRWHFIKAQWDKYGVDHTAESCIGSRTPYGASKYSADILCQEYAHTYGLKTGVFRMSCIYGPNQFSYSEQGWAVWFLIAALKGLPITIYGDGHQVRDMLYVEDCVRAYDAFHKSDETHGVYNLGGGTQFTLSLNECIDEIESITGRRSKVTYEDWRPSDQKVYVSNIDSISRMLNWRPTISPKAGLNRCADWVKNNLDVF